MKKILILLVAVSLASGMIGTNALAQNYDIKEMTPAIKQALDNRRARFNELQKYKQTGAIGEDNHGYVAVLSAGGGASAVASDENRDRRVIYTAIAEQNNLSHAMGTIEGVFAEVQRQKAQPGEYIQQDNGQWAVK